MEYSEYHDLIGFDDEMNGVRELRIPAFVGHLIRLISDSDSDSVRTGNPVHIGHPIRSLSDSDSG